MRTPNKYTRYRAKLTKKRTDYVDGEKQTTETTVPFRCDKVESRGEISFVFGDATNVEANIYKTNEPIDIREDDTVTIFGDEGRVNVVRKVDEKADLNVYRGRPRETTYFELS